MIGNQFSLATSFQAKPKSLQNAAQGKAPTNTPTSPQDQLTLSQTAKTPALFFGNGGEKVFKGSPHWIYEEFNANGDTLIIQKGSASLMNAQVTADLKIPTGGLKLDYESTFTGNVEARDKVEILDNSKFNGNLIVNQAPAIIRQSELNGHLQAVVTDVNGGEVQVAGSKVNGNLRINLAAESDKGLVLDAKNTDFGKNARGIQIIRDQSVLAVEDDFDNPAAALLRGLFGAGSSVGNVSIRSIAGRDIINTNVIQGGRDVILGDKIENGDKVHGDKIVIGGVNNAVVAAGRGSRARVTVRYGEPEKQPIAPAIDLRGDKVNITNSKLNISFDTSMPEGIVFISNPTLLEKINVKNGRVVNLERDPDGDLSKYLNR